MTRFTSEKRAEDSRWSSATASSDGSSGVYNAFKRAGERVGIKGAGPNSARKFAENEAKPADHGMEENQNALRQRNISTTQGYVQKSTRG
jgi:hypothetical protein